MKSYFTKKDENLVWKCGNPKSLLKTCVFEVTSQHNTACDGTEGDYIVMNAPDWVIVIAEKDSDFIMVKQWRHGEKQLSVEFPGGVIDKGEEPETDHGEEMRGVEEPAGILLDKEACAEQRHQQTDDRTGNQLLYLEGEVQKHPEDKTDDKGRRYCGKFRLLQG